MSPRPITENTLFYGDNLPILREYVPDESVDLVYLDPPFNSNRSYNVLFKDESGHEAEAQIEAFDDTWHWNHTTAATYEDILANAPPNVSNLIGALRQAIGTNQMMAYLVMMAARLIELHRVLKPTGSLYLHCDPTASHYLKVVLDQVFGAENYRNEIVWKRQSAHSDARTKFSDVTDTILFYAKDKSEEFKPQYTAHDADYLSKFYRFDDGDGRGPYRLDNMASPNPRPNMMYEWMGFAYPVKGWRYQRGTMQRLHDEGRIHYPRHSDGTLNTSKRPSLKRYLKEQEGSIVTNCWIDIQPLHSSDAERMGYPTQKPLALLERIIQASSNEGDVVLDPFCGCGTAIAAAQKLGRKWIGIDVTALATSLIKSRLRDMFGDVKFVTVGEPEDLQSARQLAQDDRYQFQWWALGLVRARPLGAQAGSKAGKKGSDKGIDGVITFTDDATGKPKQVLVQVKSGKVGRRDIGELVGTIDREKAAIGIFVTLEKPTRDMLEEAVAAGFYTAEAGKGYTYDRNIPKVQVYTIEELLAGTQAKVPANRTTFKRAERVKQDPGQIGMPLDDD